MPNYNTRAIPRADLGQAMHEFALDQVNYIGMRVAPPVLVGEKSATFSKLERESLLRAEGTLQRAPRSEYVRVRHSYVDDTYDCVEYGLESELDDSQRREWELDLDAELDTTKNITHRLLREQELRWQEALFNTTTFTGSDLFTDNSSEPWNAATSDVIGHVLAAKDKVRINTGMKANTLVIGRGTYNNVLNNDAIVHRIFNVQEADEAAVAMAMAPIFGMSNIFVGDAVYDGGADGGTFSGTDVWGTTYALVCATATSNNIAEPCIARTFVWQDDAGTPMTVEQYRQEERRSDVFRVRQNCDEKLIDAYFGHLLQIETT